MPSFTLSFIKLSTIGIYLVKYTVRNSGLRRVTTCKKKSAGFSYYTVEREISLVFHYLT